MLNKKEKIRFKKIKDDINLSSFFVSVFLGVFFFATMVSITLPKEEGTYMFLYLMSVFVITFAFIGLLLKITNWLLEKLHFEYQMLKFKEKGMVK